MHLGTEEMLEAKEGMRRTLSKISSDLPIGGPGSASCVVPSHGPISRSPRAVLFLRFRDGETPSQGLAAAQCAPVCVASHGLSS